VIEFKSGIWLGNIHSYKGRYHMQLSTLNKEYKLVRQDNMERFIKLSKLDPTLILVEEYWITSDQTMGNRCAYFESYSQAEEYAYMLAANRAAMNVNREKPFTILLNGKENKVDGKLDEFLAGEFRIGQTEPQAKAQTKSSGK
jgi:hypothetical protein